MARGPLIGAGLVFLRIGAVMALMPAFGEQIVPPRIRLALALAFTAIVAPAVATRIAAPAGGIAGYAVWLCAETLNGLALGFVLRLGVMAVEIAGGLAAQSGSLSQMLGTAGEPMPAMSHLLTMAVLCLGALSGLHVQLARALILSYDALPPGAIPGAGLVRDWALGHVLQAFALAFRLAAPFVIAALLYNVALGVMNRAMPALMVSFIGAPALTAGALILLAITAPLMLGVWQATFAPLIADPFTVPR